MNKYLLIIGFLFLLNACSNHELCKDSDNLPNIIDNYAFLPDSILNYAKLSDASERYEFCFDNRIYNIESDYSDPDPVVEFLNVKNKIEDLFMKSFLKNKKLDVNRLNDVEDIYIDQVNPNVKISDQEAFDYYSRNLIWYPDVSCDEVLSQVKALSLEDKKKWGAMQSFYLAGKTLPIVITRSWLDNITGRLMKLDIFQTLQNKQESVLVFSYGCCKPDIMLAEIEKLKAYSSKQPFDIVHIDSHDNSELAEFFDVWINPGILIFDDNGKLIKRLVYHYDSFEIIEMLNQGEK